MTIFPYLLSLGAVALYFGTEARKKRTYPALTIGVCVVAAILATYFRGALTAYMTWAYLPVFVTAWMSGSVISRIVELPQTLANLWERVKALLHIGQ
jgi:uncharacterized membrane protein